MEQPRRRVAFRRVLLALTGFFLLGAGLWGYDPRLAELVCGVLLLTAAVVDAASRKQ